MKGICPTCGEPVRLLGVRIAKGSGIISDKKKTRAMRLCAEHEPKLGSKATSVVSAKDGHLIRKICDGSFRKPALLVQ